MKRREFLKMANTAGAAALFSGGSMTSSKNSTLMREDQPSHIKNILVLFVDQHAETVRLEEILDTDAWWGD